MSGRIEEDEFAKKLLIHLSGEGGDGVRIDQLGTELQNADLLSNLDQEKLIEFGEVTHASHGGVTSQPNGPAQPIHWFCWIERKRPFTECLVDLLHAEPETMRPWVRLTNAGHAMTSRIKRRKGSDIDPPLTEKWTIEQICSEYGLSRATLNRLRKLNGFPVGDSNKRPMKFAATEIEDFMKSQAIKKKRSND